MHFFYDQNKKPSSFQAFIIYYVCYMEIVYDAG